MTQMQMTDCVSLFALPAMKLRDRVHASRKRPPPIIVRQKAYHAAGDQLNSLPDSSFSSTFFFLHPFSHCLFVCLIFGTVFC